MSIVWARTDQQQSPLIIAAGKRVALKRKMIFGRCAATFAVALLIPAMVIGAGASAARRPPPPQKNGQPDGNPTGSVEELDTVVVVGEKPVEDNSVLIAWMRRLVGQFSIDGYVAPVGGTNAAARHKIHGQGLCAGFNPTPAVHCEVHLQLPADILKDGMPVDLSPLSAAMILYGLEMGAPRIRYMLVDRNGIADPQLGALSGDTLTSRTPCVDVPSGCQKITRITAQPDGSLVDMQVQVEVNSSRVMTYGLSMSRVSALPVSPSSGGIR